MGHGYLGRDQEEVLKPFVSVPVVHDLGAGDLELAKVLVRLGAKQVIAIDKEENRRRPIASVIPIHCYFENYSGLIDTAFLSWPKNAFDFGLIELLRRSRVVAYLGTNTDTTACGCPQMWIPLTFREVLAHVPNRHNTLIVYGPKSVARRYLPEEYAGIFQDKVWSYDTVHAAEMPMVERHVSA